MRFILHKNDNIMWHSRYGELIKSGFEKHNLNVTTDKSAKGIPILFGPNYWKEYESGEYLFINRCFIWDKYEDISNNVAISWNGFNGNGQFCTEYSNKKNIDFDIPSIKMGEKSLLCEQSDVGRCFTYQSTCEWYKKVKESENRSIIIRKKRVLKNQTEVRDSLKNLSLYNAHVLNSTVSVDLIRHGYNVISWDKGDPCYSLNAVGNNNMYKNILLNRLNKCQWNTTEIENGNFWEQLKYKTSEKLYSWKDQ